MPLNTITLVPRFASIRHVVHRVFEQRVLQTPQGNQEYIGSADPTLTVSLSFVDPGGNWNGAEVFVFPSQEGGRFAAVNQIIAAAGVDVAAAWEGAFDALKEQFVRTQDQPAAAASTGVKWYMRVDVVDGAFDPKKPMGITMNIGCYGDPECTKFKSSFVITFADAKTIANNDRVKSELRDRIRQMDDMIAGTHANQLGMDVAALEKSKAAGANDKAIYQAQLREAEAQLLAPMRDIFAIPAVANAFVSMGQAVFTELKRVLPEWSAIEVNALMQVFLPAFAEVATS